MSGGRKGKELTKEFLLEQFLLKKIIKEISQEFNIGERTLRKYCILYNIEDKIYHKCIYCGKEHDLHIRKTGLLKNIIHDMCTKCYYEHRKTCKDLSEERQKEIKLKRKKSYRESYNISGPFYTKEVMKKTKQTKLERYGNETYNNIEKQKKTILERYNITNSFQLSNYRSYSKISQDLFWNIYNSLSKDLQEHTHFAELNREFYLSNRDRQETYIYDFIISNIKICIEFYGCYWHANPLVFDLEEDDYIRDRKVKDIWTHDFIKELYIEEKYGYDFIEVWDYEYVEDKQQIIDDILRAINWNYKKYILKTINI